MLRVLAMACVLSFNTLAISASAQSVPNDTELSALAAEAVEQAGTPAAGVLVWQAGDLRIGVAGVRETGREIAVTPDDVWHMGSNTKAMTATLIARLVEQDIVSWDDTIAQHLAPHIDDIDPAYAALTFRHLLSHRSGLRANVGMMDMIRYAAEGLDGRPMPQQRLDYAQRVLTSEPDGEAETDFGYSNAGYVVAGAMLEQATGESWETLMRREVFLPLGMNSAGFGAPGSVDTVDQPRGHRRGMFGGLSAKTGAEADNPPVLGPAGTAHMSLRDLSRFMEAHLAGARGENSPYLSAESWTELHTPPYGGDYALGWAFQGPMMLHAGSNTMWLVQMIMQPETETILIIAFNDGRTGNLQPQIRRIAEAVLSSE